MKKVDSDFSCEEITDVGFDLFGYNLAKNLRKLLKIEINFFG